MESASINDDGRARPSAPMSMPSIAFRRISSLFSWSCCSSSPKKSEDGYVEFGQNDYGREGGGSRTLGTFAGVFSPVALSMFSALLFLRVVMISRTLGPEFGGSIGTLFFLANVVSSALYIVGCAEGLVENFGPNGYLVIGGLPIPDSPWWRFTYCSILNLINLVVCLFGAGMFAKISVIIFIIVCLSLSSVMASFFLVSPMEIPIPYANALIQNSTHRVNASYTGLSWDTLSQNFYQGYTADYTSGGQITDFAIVFGVLFSGVTGIMAGANMSGELKDPGKSIPWGTMTAVLFTLISYLMVSFLSAAACSRLLLTNNFMYMMPINIFPAFITIGVLTATFSASLSNLIGSSRVLEALAKDNIYGRILKGITAGVHNGNPVAAVITSWALIQLMLFYDSLNEIAQINSVLFLLSYFATNLACLGLELTSAPNFRPSFKYFSWTTALMGLLGTVIMMFVINALYAVSSIVLCFLLVVLLHLFSPSSQTAGWGSLTQALIFHQVRKTTSFADFMLHLQVVEPVLLLWLFEIKSSFNPCVLVRKYLLLLDSRKDHVKFWRPQVLLMVRNPRSCTPLVQFVNDMKKSGLYVLGHVIVEKEFAEHEVDPTIQLNTTWLSLIDHLKVKAFIELTVAWSVREGLNHLGHLAGLGAMKPNTIVLGFRDDHEPIDFFQTIGSDYMTDKFDRDGKAFEFEGNQMDANEYVSCISDVLRMKKNVVLARNFQTYSKAQISVNRLIGNNSKESAITFLYLDPPPGNDDASQLYLGALSELTSNLRPTLLVHGIRAVTSTTL
ncbi:unnamed protein product [Nesidiocoris tenuis]|uniref:Solute carrier family 12 member 9 n=1 Tax=Nesidiocoris tenuis TaxID=355587 RepID=A0A6H5FWC6_9HEMI|nr:unnamed protein product [Nesidiocoris tenuis]